MNTRTAKKIVDCTARAVAHKQPVRYSRRQVRQALHHLRRRNGKCWRQAVDYAGVSCDYCAPVFRTRTGKLSFPWEVGSRGVGIWALGAP